MAFASVGTLGSALSSGNNQSTLVLTTSAAAEVGNLVVVAIAVDNRTGTGGASTDVSGVSDNSTSGPNNWQRAVGFTNTNGGAAQDGADISIWYAKITTQIDNGGTITATFTSATTSDATAMSAWEFTVTGGVAVENTNTLANDAAAAGSLDATTANIECLRFRATASESNSSTVWTKTAAFDSLITQAVSGAGTSATEMGVRGEFDISTGTGSASAPTGGAGAVDNASAYVAFKETTAHVAEMRLAGTGSLSVQAVKKPSEANLTGNGQLSIIQDLASAFSAADKTSNADLTNSDRTVTANNSAGGCNARSVAATVASQKVYIEYTIGAAMFSSKGGFILGATALTGNMPGETSVSTAFYLLNNGNFICADSANSGNTITASYTANDRLGCAFDTAAGLVWFRKNGGAWNSALGGTQNPATTQGGANVPFAGPYKFIVTMDANSGDAVTVAFASADWIDSAPSGFVQLAGATGNLHLDMAAQERLGGTGSFSADTTVTSAGGTAHVGEARFAGAGNLSVNIQNTKQAEARYIGAGNLSINATAQFIAEMRLAGVGGLSVQPQLNEAVYATFGGVGSFSVNVTSVGTQAGEARLTGAGNLSVNATVMQAGAAVFAGSGSLSVTMRQTIAAQATLQGAGSFSPLVSQAWAAGAILAGIGNLSFHGMQLKPLIPDGDSSTGSWLTEVDSLPLFPSIDEIVPLDADYIKSTPAPTVDICKISLSNPTTATLVAPVSVLYRYGKSGSDTAALQVRLLQGTTMIAVWQHDDIAAGFVTVEQVLTDGMISNITDWNDLFLEFRSGTITTHMGRATFSGSGVM